MVVAALATGASATAGATFLSTLGNVLASSLLGKPLTGIGNALGKTGGIIGEALEDPNAALRNILKKDEDDVANRIQQAMQEALKGFQI